MCFQSPKALHSHESIPVRRTDLQEWGISAIYLTQIKTAPKSFRSQQESAHDSALLVEKLGLIKQRCIARMTGQMIHTGSFNAFPEKILF